MTNILLKGLKKTINSSLASVGMQLTRNNDHDWSDTANFIPLRQTLEASREAGLSVGDYVDSVMNGVPGSSQNTIDMMASAGVFSNTAPTIIEIGPGTGRYLEKH